MSVHYENNAPFLSITNLERVIEVSHWGNIAVEETIDLKHSGATLKGPFSRYEYQRETQSGLSSVKSFKVIIMLRRLRLIYIAGKTHLKNNLFLCYCYLSTSLFTLFRSLSFGSE